MALHLLVNLAGFSTGNSISSQNAQTLLVDGIFPKNKQIDRVDTDSNVGSVIANQFNRGENENEQRKGITEELSESGENCYCQVGSKAKSEAGTEQELKVPDNTNPEQKSSQSKRGFSPFSKSKQPADQMIVRTTGQNSSFQPTIDANQFISKLRDMLGGVQVPGYNGNGRNNGLEMQYICG